LCPKTWKKHWLERFLKKNIVQDLNNARTSLRYFTYSELGTTVLNIYRIGFSSSRQVKVYFTEQFTYFQNTSYSNPDQRLFSLPFMLNTQLETSLQRDVSIRWKKFNEFTSETLWKNLICVLKIDTEEKFLDMPIKYKENRMCIIIWLDIFLICIRKHKYFCHIAISLKWFFGKILIKKDEWIRK